MGSGFSALAAALVVGARKDYGRQAILPHNSVYVLLGAPAVMQAAWFSWLDQGRERWPELRLVFAMLAGGAPFHLERLALRSPLDVRSMLDPNVYLDVSTHGRRAIELCIETFGVEQLVYGSDAPVVDPAPTLRAVRGFGDSVAHIILHDNPEKLLRPRVEP